MDLRAYARTGERLVPPGFKDAAFVSLLHQGWKAERLFRYRPLIYFAAFGDDSIFQCLETALASLDRFAQWPGSVLILTDRAPDALAPLIPERLRPRIHVHRSNPGDVLGFTLARYAVGAAPVAHTHQPLLYVDADVVFDGDLTGLMIDVLLSGCACFLPERTMFDYDFYGEPLFRADGGFLPSYDRGLSSGAIGIPTLAQVSDAFRLILESRPRLSGDRGEPGRVLLLRSALRQLCVPQARWVRRHGAAAPRQPAPQQLRGREGPQGLRAFLRRGRGLSAKARTHGAIL